MTLNPESIVFYVFALGTLVSAVGVLLNIRSTVNAAMCLMLSMVSIAGLFVMLHAEFIGVLQVLVYAGAIVVLFVFVIMLLNLSGPAMAAESHFFAKLLGAAVLLAAAVKLSLLFLGPGEASAEIDRQFGTVAQIGRTLFTDYVVAVEAAGVLLLAGLVAAVVLAKRELD